MVQPPHDQHGAKRRILVAIDESDASERVARFVNAFFRPGDAEVLALNVARGETTWFPPTIGYGWVIPWQYAVSPAELEDLRKETVEQAERTIDELPIQADEEIVELGEPAAMIVHTAHERAVDLIVVGSHHKNVFERLLAPSVSRDVLRDADLPVLVVP